MSMPYFLSTPVPRPNPQHPLDLAEENRILRVALAEAAQVIVRCIGEESDFDGDVEAYACSLLDLAIPELRL